MCINNSTAVLYIADSLQIMQGCEVIAHIHKLPMSLHIGYFHLHLGVRHPAEQMSNGSVAYGDEGCGGPLPHPSSRLACVQSSKVSYNSELGAEQTSVSFAQIGNYLGVPTYHWSLHTSASLVTL